ncbi:FixH family protein [Leptospira sarikeiensis]|uniref:Nitrogen fixation protein FixH n=1 Tax=Leptospira sarikeiensis TaxID=2484943 RepID=A0A4R9K110_9LEPT|nr:FixH family protein [Leptospira sarikeiensis]TGL58388.1 nitrogen fixation protein FixH [Leptospira sarikeiensis]
MDTSLKRAFLVIKIAFLTLFVATFFTVRMALAGHTPAIDSNYYEKGLKYEESILSQKKMIQNGYTFEGAWIQNLEKLKTGKQSLALDFLQNGKKIRNAKIVLQLDKTATAKFNQTVELKETSAGNYAGEILIPFQGDWRISLSAKIPEGELERTFSAKVKE